MVLTGQFQDPTGDRCWTRLVAESIEALRNFDAVKLEALVRQSADASQVLAGEWGTLVEGRRVLMQLLALSDANISFLRRIEALRGSSSPSDHADPLSKHGQA